MLEHADWFVEALPAGGVAIAGQKFPFFFHQRLSFNNIYYYAQLLPCFKFTTLIIEPFG